MRQNWIEWKNYEMFTSEAYHIIALFDKEKV